MTQKIPEQRKMKQGSNKKKDKKFPPQKSQNPTQQKQTMS